MRGPLRFAAPTAAVVLVAVAALEFMQRAPEDATMLVGGAIVLVGLGLLAISRAELGASFAIGPRAAGLVTHGLYSRIPHPMYVFLDVALLGGILMLGRPWLLTIVGVVAIVQVWQARREARVLEQAFGDAYRSYRERTWW